MSLKFGKEGQTIRFELERILPPYTRIFELAKSTGFCKRVRKIHPVIFLQLLLFAPCVHSHATVAEIWRTYQNLTESDIAYSSFVGRLDDSASRFFKAVLDECIRSSVGNMTSNSRNDMHICDGVQSGLDDRPGEQETRR